MTEKNKELYIEKNLSLLAEYMDYLGEYDVKMPKNANIVFFDLKDPKFNKYNAEMLKRVTHALAPTIHVTKVDVDSNVPVWSVSNPYLMK